MKKYISLKTIKNRRSSQLLIIATVLLGLIIGMQIRDTVDTSAASVNVQEQINQLSKSIEKEKIEAEQLKAEIAALEADNEKMYQSLDSSKDNQAINVLNNNLARVKKLAGLTDVEGTGLVINLADAQEIPSTMLLDDPSYYIVHQTDLRELVNVLLSGGAEAISINGERLIATSTQMCAGPTIIINSRRYTSPYVIHAIGNPQRMREKLEQSSIYNTLIVYFNQESFNVTESDKVFVPKYIINTKEN